MRARTSIIWKSPKEDFISLVKNSFGIGQILKHYGFENKGSNHNTVRKRIKELGVDISHFNSRIRKKDSKFILSLEDVLIENSPYSRSHVKSKLLKNNVLKNICYECGQKPMWRKKKLVLVLDHINGISSDYRLQNLRLLCPNCNSQTSTFAGRNRQC